MDELEIARAIAEGRLTSPQTVGGFALYAMRMSGTGVSYRRGLDEFVWRDPAIYLSQDMIDRCAGLPVIMEHPEAATLNSEEFADRVVGAAMFGYVVDDELWCITRIYDADAIELMEKQQLSTSPAVVFGDPSVNSKMALKDGKEILIEGKPTIIDHLAICRRGVWDKGGPAAGIDVVRKDSVTMSEEEKKADAARKDAEEKKEREDAAKADAEAGQKLDTILKHVDSLGKRMDAWDEKEKAKCDAEEKARKDAEEKEEKEKDKPEELAADKAKKDAEMIADKAKKDAEEKEEKEKKEEEEKKADAARKDSDDMRRQIADLQTELSSVRSKMPKPTGDADFADMARIQADADRVYSAHSKSAPRPMDGETKVAYRRRLAGELKNYSSELKDADLGVVAIDGPSFDFIEKRIYADAMDAAMHPMVAGDDLLEIRRKDPETGHLIKEYHGQPRAWMSSFSAPPRLARFNLDKRGNA